MYGIFLFWYLCPGLSSLGGAAGAYGCVEVDHRRSLFVFSLVVTVGFLRFPWLKPKRASRFPSDRWIVTDLWHLGAKLIFSSCPLQAGRSARPCPDLWAHQGIWAVADQSMVWDCICMLVGNLSENPWRPGLRDLGEGPL